MDGVTTDPRLSRLDILDGVERRAVLARNLSRLLETGTGQGPPNGRGYAAPAVALPPCPACLEALDGLPCGGRLHEQVWTVRPTPQEPAGTP